MRYVILILFLWQAATASLFMSNTSYEEDIRVLRSFNIDENFLYDPHFRDAKQSMLEGKRREHMMKKYEDAFVFVPILRDMINESGIPAAFLYLAMAESEFSVRAHSPKKAAGLWQFVPKTAQLYGLKINNHVDERRDPIKSTRAAITYLKDLHSKFGKWYLAALAYNCGAGRMERAIKKAGSTELTVLLDAKNAYLPKESRNYIRKILSLAMAFNSVQMMVQDDASHLLNRGAAYPIAALRLKGGTPLQPIAQSMGIPLEELRSYNRHLKSDFLPANVEQYEVYIPYGKLANFKENYNPIQDAKSRYLVHTVQKGETPAMLSAQYGISWKAIKDANHLKSDALSVKSNLIIPYAATTTTLSTQEASKSSDEGALYVIREGDTLHSIAQRFSISREQLMKANALQSSLIRAGDTLVIPN